ncbi:hypothetical protein DsansV1_C20g0164321 [Dioscorea sansibarensis]
MVGAGIEKVLAFSWGQMSVILSSFTTGFSFSLWVDSFAHELLDEISQSKKSRLVVLELELMRVDTYIFSEPHEESSQHEHNEEINIFPEHYFEPYVSCGRRRCRRKDEGVSSDVFTAFSTFNYIGRGQGCLKIRWLSENELHVAHTLIVRNCPKVQPFYERCKADRVLSNFYSPLHGCIRITFCFILLVVILWPSWA